MSQQVIKTTVYLGFIISDEGRVFSVSSPSGLFIGNCASLVLAMEVINNIKTLITDEQSRAGLGY